MALQILKYQKENIIVILTNALLLIIAYTPFIFSQTLTLNILIS